MTEVEKLIIEKLSALDGKVSTLDSKVTTLEEKMEQGYNTLDKKITKTQMMIENDISLKIDIIGEGHDFLKQRLDEALMMEKKRERMELDIVNLRMDVQKIKEHLDIA